VLFSGLVYLIYERRLYGELQDATIPYSGVDAVLTYLTAFVLEKSLSIDNLFVMVLIFQSYGIPGTYQHRSCSGHLGSHRHARRMILGGVWLVTNFQWVMYLFGGYLVFQASCSCAPRRKRSTRPRPDRCSSAPSRASCRSRVRR